MKFPLHFCLLLYILLFWTSGYGQQASRSALTIPEALMKDANDVVRMDYSKLTVDSKKEATLEIKYVVTILNNKSSKNEKYIFYNKNLKINNLSAKIYDSFGNLVESYNKNDFNDRSAIDRSTMYSDNRIKYIELNHNSYPYTVEFEYKKVYDDILYYPNCYIQGYNSSLENLTFIVETPPELQIRYKARNIDAEPVINNSSKKVTYEWKIANRSAIKSEDFSPSSRSILPYIEITPRFFQYDRYEGDAKDWESFGMFFYNLIEGRDELSPDMRAVVKELTSGLSTNEEKIKALYRFLQDNTRYVSVQLGIGGYQPFDAKYVEKNKYGDCKALSNFMLSMLKETGIEAYPGIIYRNDDMRINVDEEFPALFGNHMLLYVPSEDIWLECTSNDYPLNYLGASNDNRSVLLLTAEGGKLTKSPAFSIMDNTEHSKLNFIINEDGSANIQGNLITKGPKHELYRYIENEISKEDFEDYFLKTSDLPAFSIESLELKSSEDNPEAILDFDIIVGRYATKAGKRLFIPLNRLNAFSQVPSQTEERIHPIEVIRGYQEIDENLFQVPKGYEVESIPKKEINLETDYGKYKIKIEIEENTIKYHRTLEIQPVNLAPEEFESFRNFYKEVAKADDMKIVLVKKKT